MPDVVGYRAKIGVIVPSTNTVVEHDFARVRPPGVTFHSGRFLVEAPDLSSDEAFLHFLDLIRQTIPTAVHDLMTCKPDHLLMGMSAETFWGGKEGNAAFQARVAEIAGDIGITSGAAACNAALERLGEQVYGYFTECGYEVKRVHGLRCESATSIADVTPETLVGVLKELDGNDIDAIVQCGTNLSMVEVADQAERWLGKPVLAINAICLWHALRTLDINDQFVGHGMVLREF